jgi:hypothetical protein
VAKFASAVAKKAFGKSFFEFAANIKTTAQVFTEYIENLFDTCQGIFSAVVHNENVEL